MYLLDEFTKAGNADTADFWREGGYQSQVACSDGFVTVSVYLPLIQNTTHTSAPNPNSYNFLTRIFRSESGSP
jgi:hypothetical protein